MGQGSRCCLAGFSQLRFRVSHKVAGASRAQQITWCLPGPLVGCKIEGHSSKAGLMAGSHPQLLPGEPLHGAVHKMAAGFLSVSGVRGRDHIWTRQKSCLPSNQSQKWYLIGLLQLEAVTTASPCSREELHQTVTAGREGVTGRLLRVCPPQSVT